MLAAIKSVTFGVHTRGQIVRAGPSPWRSPPGILARIECIPYLTESVYEVVLEKSIPTQIRQLVLYIRNDKGYVDGFVWELPFAKRLLESTFCEKNTREPTVRAGPSPWRSPPGIRAPCKAQGSAFRF